MGELRKVGVPPGRSTHVEEFVRVSFADDTSMDSPPRVVGEVLTAAETMARFFSVFGMNRPAGTSATIFRREVTVEATEWREIVKEADQR
jgi:hypothetical protein